MPSLTTRSLRHQPKTQEVYARLREMAHALGPEARFPPVLELREQVGVSLGTLNNALKVLEADNIIYRIQSIGIFVSPSLQRNISLICTTDFFQECGASPFWKLLVESVGERAKAKNESFSCHFSVPNGCKDTPFNVGLMRQVEACEIQGILGIGLDQAAARWIEDRGIPFVAFAGPGKWAVRMDTHLMIKMGVEELVSLGCKRVSFWNVGSPIKRDVTFEGEIENDLQWRESLRHHRLPVHEYLIRNLAYEHCLGHSHQEQGFDLARKVFSGPRDSWPDGILCGDDLMTHGMLLAMDKLGVCIGKDVKVVSHANRKSNVLMGREHLITRLEFDPAEIVRIMFDILETVMAGNMYKETSPSVKPILYRSIDF